MTPWNIIQTLQNTSSRTAKVQLITSEATAKNCEFFDGCKLALDSFVTFGIKQVPQSNISGPGLDWNQFSSSVQSLMYRSVTGNAARELVKGLMERSTQDQWNFWYRRILLKDLKCGVSEKSINTAVKQAKRPEFAIPVFSCQLAHDSKNHTTKLTGVKQIDYKMDGVRCLTIVYPNGDVEQFSRNGKKLENFPKICTQMAATTLGSEAWVFDGEIMSNTFQALMKQVYRKSNVQTDDAALYLFDMLPLSAFKAGICRESQSTRTFRLQTWHKQNKSVLNNVHVLNPEEVDLDTDEGRARMEELNRMALADGVEGIMMKDIDAPYQCKRSTAWLKLKPVITVDLDVYGLEEGTGENEGRLGALVCMGVDQGKAIQVNVGSGFTDVDREMIWADSARAIGQTVEVVADAITENQDGSFSLRFPRFKCWRGFTPGEKL